MIAIHRSIHYTSLKDLMAESPPSTVLLTWCRGDSWREIPIRDPLLQHAAWAYLQPMMMMMMAERQSKDDGRRWWRRFHHAFCWLLRCFNGVVFVGLRDWFPERLRERLVMEFESDERERESVKQGSCSKP